MLRDEQKSGQGEKGEKLKSSASTGKREVSNSDASGARHLALRDMWGLKLTLTEEGALDSDRSHPHPTLLPRVGPREP